MEDAIRRAMSPSTSEIAAAPLSSHAEIVRALLGGAGTHALDVGCGAGTFTWHIVPLFAHVTGIDVKAGRIEEAQASARTRKLKVDFRVASAETMPFPDASFDAVVFSNSLHHIPDMDEAMREAARVVRPGGLVYVMEPVPGGTYFEATRLVNDETEIRTEAFRAMHRCGPLSAVSQRLYRARRAFASLEEWRDDQIARDPKRGTLFEASKDEIRRRFEGAATREGGKLVFDQVSRVDLFRRHH